ncbi:radical SAM protein [Caldanaerobacter subterraneus KAk]|uniref:SPL family radical SAM protein n=1 Tax=Caldanaerobacter subterraneus TaxID=911092 RepID=UPI0032BFCA55
MKKFSHIYVEEDVKNHPLTIKILNKFPKSKIVYINRYSEVFNRPNQNYLVQKKGQNLIIAKKRHEFVYKGSELCEDFGNIHFFHTSNIYNCVYECEYCYLQGLYPSAHLVIFVNLEDYFREIDKLIERKKIYLSISYETDLLALEYLTGFTREWIEYASSRDLLLEIRTKSANFSALEDLEIPLNVIFAWTLLPQPVIDRYEKFTPSLEMRLKSIKKAISRGLRIRISIEPVMYLENFEEVYSQFVKEVFSCIPEKSVRDVNIGAFRLPKEQAKRIEKLNEASLIFCYDTVVKDGVFTYRNASDYENFVAEEVKKYVPSEKVYVFNKKEKSSLF